MAANGSIEQCMVILREISGTIVNARKAFMSGDACVVSREALLDRLDQLQRSLPGAVNTAMEYVKNIQMIQQQAEQDRTAMLRDAQNQAQQMLQDAQQKSQAATSAAEYAAQETHRKSQEEATSCVEAARAEAARILEDAQRRAQALVGQEEIVRRARVEAKELKEGAQEEILQVRQNTFDYLDGLMEAMDRRLSETINDLRMERTELNNHR